MKPICLLTYHGSFVSFCEETGQLHHVDEHVRAVQKCPLALMCGDFADLRFVGLDDRFAFQVERQVDGAFSLRRAGNYLRAVPGGSIDTEATEVGDWEKFILLDVDKIELVSRLREGRWLCFRSSIAPALVQSVEFVGGGNLKVDQRLLRLVPHFPLANLSATDDIILFEDEWKPNRLTRFRPLIYYVAFGSPRHLKMAATSIRSFEKQSSCSLEYAIFTDGTGEDALGCLSQSLRSRISVVREPPPLDKLDAYLHRYRIAGWSGIEPFRPVIYVDTDVMCAADPVPLLHGLMSSRQIEVALENYSLLSEKKSVGGQLIAEDGLQVGDKCGFNSGIIGFQKASDVRETLQIVEAFARRCANVKGRGAYENWYDQVPANYIAAKFGGFATGLMTEHVTQVLPFMEPSGEYVSVKARSPILTHYWGAGPARLDVMALALRRMNEPHF